MPVLSQEIAEKSVAAALSAIEIYNKPDFKYREETFSILMVNAWELLLKAKHLQDNKDNLDTIIDYRSVKDSSGKVKRQPKLNRSGNAVTLGILQLLEILLKQPTSGLTKPCYENVQLLIEVRDNAIHFVNKDLHFSRRVQEIGTASLMNYLGLVQGWFGFDLSKYNFFLMPISFFHGFEAAAPSSVSSYTEQVQKFLDYVNKVEKDCDSDDPGIQHVTIGIETRFVRSKDSGSVPFRWSDDPNAPAITVKEEDVLKAFPMDYRGLTDQLKSRYVNFCENRDYHDVRKKLEADPAYCKVRLLDPHSPRSSQKRFYNTEIFKEFDKKYKKWAKKEPSK